MKTLTMLLVSICSIVLGAAEPTNYSAQIDAVLDKQYAAIQVQPNSVINDDTFVRRAYLTIIGRAPTVQEYDSFTAAQMPDKRNKLIQYLVSHPGYTSNQFNFWADILRLRERIAAVNNLNGAPYINYVKEQIAANKPYDKFVKDMLLATGSYYDNPATGYYFRDFGMPLDNLIGTFKVFAATDIGCAQCHDDPFQDFTQMQFYQMASMFNQIDLNRTNPEYREKTKQLREQVEALIKADPIKNRGLNNRLNNFVRATAVSVDIEPNKQLKLPHDYQYSNAKPNDVVSPNVLTGRHNITHKDDLRLDAVDWLVSDKHPTFVKNVVNRYWQQVFGKYIIDSYDNIYADEKLNGELMNTLAKIFVEQKYDSKRFLTTLYNTKLFQRELYSGANADSEKFVFIGPVQRRLSAEQLWDSAIAIAVELPESFKLSFHKEYVVAMKTTPEQINIETLNAKLEDYNKAIRNKYDKAPKYKNFVLVRASEINDTSQMNTILEQLGRSDRELIQTSSLEGSVTQVISFMNGQLAEVATNKDTHLAKLIAGKSPTESIEIIFKGVLSRKPTLEEKSTFAGVQDDDIIWALVNSSEFKFNK